MTSGTVTRRPRFPYSFDHAGSPYPTPAPGAALRIAFVGQSTYFRATSLDEQSERSVLRIKHEFDILHLAFGVDADGLEDVLDEHDVTINLHNEPYESFENRVCIHLAAGHLVISEVLNPRHGLEPGIDYLEV